MPDKQRSDERRDRLYLLYLQPWVLEPSWAIPEVVPHIAYLNGVKECIDGETLCVYSYSRAWKKYISQNIVSRHAHRMIVQFMAACCGKPKSTDPMPETEASGNGRECPANDLLLAQVHALIDGLGASMPKPVKTKAMGQAKDKEGAEKESDEEGNALSTQMSKCLARRERLMAARLDGMECSRS